MLSEWRFLKDTLKSVLSTKLSEKFGYFTILSQGYVFLVYLCEREFVFIKEYKLLIIITVEISLIEIKLYLFWHCEKIMTPIIQ